MSEDLDNIEDAQSYASDESAEDLPSFQPLPEGGRKPKHGGRGRNVNTPARAQNPGRLGPPPARGAQPPATNDARGQQLADLVNDALKECERLRPLAFKEARGFLVKMGELKKRIDDIYSTELRAVNGNAEELSDLRQIRASVNINHRLASGIVATFDRLQSLSDYQLITED